MGVRFDYYYGTIVAVRLLRLRYLFHERSGLSLSLPSPCEVKVSCGGLSTGVLFLTVRGESKAKREAN